MVKRTKAIRRAAVLVVALISATALSACSPSLSPLYRDYDAPDSSFAKDRVVAALREAGWDTVSTDLPHAIATEERVLSNWGLYRVAASLEVAPLGPDYVRVFVHPYRQYVVGGKSKILYLTGRIESRFIPRLNEAFEEQGLHLAGTPFDRDDTKLQ